MDYKELANRLATAVRESPNSEEQARRVWEIWTQCAMFDERDRFYNFSLYSGLPDGVTRRYMEVCKEYEQDRLAALKKAARKQP